MSTKNLHTGILGKHLLKKVHENTQKGCFLGNHYFVLSFGFWLLFELYLRIHKHFHPHVSGFGIVHQP